MSTPFVKWLMTRSGLEPNFFRVNLCCEVRLGLVTCGDSWGDGFRSVQGTVLVWWNLVQGVSKWRAFSM